MGDEKKVPALLAAVTLMRTRPEWSGVLAYKSSDNVTILRRPIPDTRHIGTYPRWLMDADVTDATLWLQGEGVAIGRGVTADALNAVARDTAFTGR